MKKNSVIIMTAMLATSLTVSAQFDIDAQIQQEVQQKIDKKIKETEDLLGQPLTSEIESPQIPAQLLQETFEPANLPNLYAQKLTRLFYSFATANLQGHDRKKTLFLDISTRLSPNSNHPNTISHKLRKGHLQYIVGLVKTRIPANSASMPSIIFVAHSDVDSIAVNRESLIRSIDKERDPYKGRAITVLSTDGESPLSVEGICNSAILVELYEQIAVDTSLKHGDVYFCLFKDKKDMCNPEFWKNNITGLDSIDLVVFLNGDEYATCRINDTAISKLMENSLKQAKLSWISVKNSSALDALNLPIIQLYCGMNNPGTQNEWACVEDMMDAIRLARSMVSCMGELNKKN